MRTRMDKTSRTVIIGDDTIPSWDMDLDTISWSGFLWPEWKNTVSVTIHGNNRDRNLKLHWIDCAGDEEDSECGRRLNHWLQLLHRGKHLELQFSTPQIVPSDRVTPNYKYFYEIKSWRVVSPEL